MDMELTVKFRFGGAEQILGCFVVFLGKIEYVGFGFRFYEMREII